MPSSHFWEEKSFGISFPSFQLLKKLRSSSSSSKASNKLKLEMLIDVPPLFVPLNRHSSSSRRIFDRFSLKTHSSFDVCPTRNGEENKVSICVLLCVHEFAAAAQKSVQSKLKSNSIMGQNGFVYFVNRRRNRIVQFCTLLLSK